MKDHEITVLLVDDDDVDVRIIKRAFAKHHLKNSIIVARDGLEAIDILKGKDQEDSVRTDQVLVLLDLNMPRMNGFEFLDAVRSDPELKRTLIFVLSTSESEGDLDAAYDQHVAGYLVKSRVGEDLMAIIPLMEQFLANVKFPNDPLLKHEQGDARVCQMAIGT